MDENAQGFKVQTNGGNTSTTASKDAAQVVQNEENMENTENTEGAFQTPIGAPSTIVDAKRRVESAKQQFILSPNPANDVATLTFNLNKKTDLTFDVLNEAGQMILRKSLQNTQSGSLNVDTREWASGAYFIHLTDGKGVKTVKRLVVQH